MICMQLDQVHKKVFVLSACLHAENSTFRQLVSNFTHMSTVQGGTANTKSAILLNAFEFVKHR